MDYNDFPEALIELKLGHNVQRMSWDEDEYLCAQFPDENSEMSFPYIYKHNSDGTMYPYMVSNSDLFGEDWISYESNSCNLLDILKSGSETVKLVGKALEKIVSDMPSSQKSKLIIGLLEKTDGKFEKLLNLSDNDDIPVNFMMIYGKPYCDAFFSVFTVEDLIKAVDFKKI